MQSTYNSRLQRKYEKNNQKRAVVLLIGSLILIVLLIIYGLPFLLNLSSTVSSLKPKSSDQSAGQPGIAPTIPRFSEGLLATKSAEITINGAADANISVEIFQDGILLGTTTASSDGTFSYNVTLNQGTNNFTADAVRPGGEKSAKSETYTVTYSSAAPKLEITSPPDGGTVKDNPVRLTGNTDPGDSITVNGHFIIVNGDGSFSYNYNLGSGDNKIKFVATDNAGNTTEKEITLHYSQ